MSDFEKEKKILGVIGGLGPLASAYFMRLVTEMTDAKIDQDHIEILMHSMPQIPDRTGFILGESQASPLPQMLEAGRGLVKGGAEVIAIPCITAHFFQKTLENELGVIVLNAIEESCKTVKAAGIKKVGIMATDGTVKSGLFQKVFEKQGVECVVPGTEGQQNVMHIIYNNVKAGIPIEKNLFLGVTRELFDKGAECVLLGCTELSIMKRDNPELFISENTGFRFLDVLEVLAGKSVQMCGRLNAKYEKLI